MKDEKLIVRIDGKLLNAVRHAAKKSGTDVSDFVRKTLSEKLLMVTDRAPQTEGQQKLKAIRMMAEALELLGGSLTAETKAIIDGLREK